MLIDELAVFKFVQADVLIGVADAPMVPEGAAEMPKEPVLAGSAKVIPHWYLISTAQPAGDVVAVVETERLLAYDTVVKASADSDTCAEHPVQTAVFEK